MAITKSLAVVLLLLAPLVAWGQTISLPPEVRGQPGEFIVVRAETTDTLVKWHVIDNGINLFPQELQKDTLKAVVVSLKPGRYRLLAVSAKDGTPSDFAQCTVIVGDAPIVVVDPDKPPPDPDKPPDPVKPTAATYFFEKDDGPIPPAVSSALNKLNREKKIIATHFEQDQTDGTGQTPEQYRPGLAAARTAGLPALVVTAGNTVLRIVKNPTTEAHVLEAVP